MTGMTVHMTHFAEKPMDARYLRNAFGRFATGVTVITTRTASGKFEGLTANSFAAVSLDPPLVSWSLRRTSRSFDGFFAANHFAVNVLAAQQHALCRHFNTPRLDKFEDIAFAEGMHGAPLLTGSLATFECRTENTFEGGDHLIFIGRVARAIYRDGEPLIFSSGRFCLPSLIEEHAAGDKVAATLSEDWGGL